MTDTEIIEALATKVMGWKRNSDGWIDAAGVQQRYVGSCGSDCDHPQFNPLTDPAASKQVREKLAERFSWRFSKSREGFGFTLFDGPYIDAPLAYQHLGADTEERAVALCALKSVEVEP